MTRWPERFVWNAFTLYHVRAERRLPYEPLETIRALQARRCQAMAEHAYRTVRHYRAAMDERGLRPRDMRSVDDLAKLPLISGKDVAHDPSRFNSSRYASAARGATRLELRSSGTSGFSKVVSYNPAALFLALAHGHRQRIVLGHFTGRRNGYKEMKLTRESAVSSQIREFYESRSWVPRRFDLQRDAITPEETFERAAARYNAFRPDVLRGYGAALGAFFREASERDLPMHRPDVVIYGADRMPDADRELIETRFETPVISFYQAVECLRIGFQCEHRRGFHLSLDHAAVRVVDPNGDPVGPGERGEIVISNLTNRATVLLNYRLGDIVTLSSEACPCGRTLPRIERIDGRAEDAVLVDGRRMHSSVVLAPLLRVPGVVQLQLVQQAPCRFTVDVVTVPDASWSTVSSSLVMTLRDTIGASVELVCRQTRRIAAEPSGKVKAVISHCIE